MSSFEDRAITGIHKNIHIQNTGKKSFTKKKILEVGISILLKHRERERVKGAGIRLIRIVGPASRRCPFMFQLLHSQSSCMLVAWEISRGRLRSLDPVLMWETQKKSLAPVSESALLWLFQPLRVNSGWKILSLCPSSLYICPSNKNRNRF